MNILSLVPEIQHFPKGWKVVPFDDAFEDATGGNAKIKQSDYQKEGCLHVIDQGKDLIAGYVDDFSMRCQVNLPVVLFGDHTKSLKFVTEPFALGADGVKVLAPCPELDARFGYYYLHLVRFPSDTGYSRHFKYLKAIKVPLPPLDEQRRIAAILDKADAIRRKRQESTGLLNKLICSVYRDTFGDISRYPQRNLSDVCEFITKGTTPSSSQLRETPDEGDIPFLKVLHIQNDGKIDFDNRPSFISAEIHNGPFKRSKVFPGDVLMNIVGPPLGKIGYVQDQFSEWNVNQAVAIFRAKKEIAPLYLFHTLRHKKILDRIIGLAAGIRQLNLSLEQCRLFEIPVPPRLIQDEFVAKIEKISKMERCSSELSANSDRFLNSCIHRAFRGEL